MPTYDYICRSCDFEFEEFQQITAPVKKKCPKCGELKLERLIGTGAGVLFKGTGFYETDYRSDSYKKGAEAEKKSKDDSSKDKKDSKSGKSESKTESKKTSDGAAAKKSTSKTDK